MTVRVLQPDARLRTTAGTDALWFNDSGELLEHVIGLLTAAERT